jgi:hypothetical protein
MKTYLIFILVGMVALGSFAQSSTSTDQKNGSSLVRVTPENQSFSITLMYPNPVKDFVNVEFYSPEASTVQVSLINILGTEVKKWDPNTISKGDQKLKLDLSFLKTGVYFLKISSSGRVVTQVLKKN